MKGDKIDSVTSEQPNSDKSESRLKDFAGMVLWLMLWPIVVGSLLILCMIIISMVTAQSSTEASEVVSGIQMRFGVFMLVSLAVVICWGLMAAVRRDRRRFIRKGEPVLKVYMWTGVLLGGLIMTVMADPESYTTDAGIDVQTSSIVPPSLQSDAEITELLREVGAKDIDKIDTRFVDGYSDQDKIVENQAGTYSAYIDQTGKWAYGEMTILRANDQTELKRTVAHEYLHHVWFKMLDDDTKQRLTSDLITMYGRDGAMQGRIVAYSDSQTLQPTELFSYYCTEASDQYLTRYVLSRCQKYINRSSLVYYR